MKYYYKDYSIEINDSNGLKGKELTNAIKDAVQQIEDANNWLGIDLPKGKISDEFKQYLRDRGLYFEPSENGDAVHFEIQNGDDDCKKEADAILNHYDNLKEDSCSTKDSDKEVIEIAMSDYGMNEKEAEIFVKSMNDKAKQALLEGFKSNAKASFSEDSCAKDADVDNAQFLIDAAKKLATEKGLEVSILGKASTNEVKIEALSNYENVLNEFKKAFDVYNEDKEFEEFFIKNKTQDSCSTKDAYDKEAFNAYQEAAKEVGQYKIKMANGQADYSETPKDQLEAAKTAYAKYIDAKNKYEASTLSHKPGQEDSMVTEDVTEQKIISPKDWLFNREKYEADGWKKLWVGEGKVCIAKAKVLKTEDACSTEDAKLIPEAVDKKLSKVDDPHAIEELYLIWKHNLGGDIHNRHYKTLLDAYSKRINKDNFDEKLFLKLIINVISDDMVKELAEVNDSHLWTVPNRYALAQRILNDEVKEWYEESKEETKDAKTNDISVEDSHFSLDDIDTLLNASKNVTLSWVESKENAVYCYTNWSNRKDKNEDDYIAIRHILTDHGIDAKITVVKREWRDENKESAYLIRITLKSEDTLKEDSKKIKDGYLGQTLEDFLEIRTNDPDEIVINGDEDDPIYRGDVDNIPEELLEADFLEFGNDKGPFVINIGAPSGDGYYETLADFLDDCNSDQVSIFDVDKEDTVFEGYKEDVPDELLNKEFASYDAPNYLWVNIEVNEDEDDLMEDSAINFGKENLSMKKIKDSYKNAKKDGKSAFRSNLKEVLDSLKDDIKNSAQIKDSYAPEVLTKLVNGYDTIGDMAKKLNYPNASKLIKDSSKELKSKLGI